MPPDLREVTRDFALGQATLETWRAAAHEERRHQKLARDILVLIEEWDTSVWTDSTRARARIAMRDLAKKLVPPAPPPEPEKPKWTTRQPAEKSSLYEAGLRTQWRR